MDGCPLRGGKQPMSRLYDTCQFVIKEIERRGLDPFKSRGALALETGFLISSVGPTDPDDPERLSALRNAAHSVLQIEVPA
jgi:hypothetical protein